MIHWNSAAWAAIIGAGVATAGTLVLEVILKPAYARKRAASVLLVEVQLNRRLLVAISEHRAKEPERVADTVSLTARGWKAVEQEIHYLPPDILEAVLLRYAQFDEINAIVSNYSRKVDLLLQLEGSPQMKALVGELESDNEVFGEAVKSTVEGCDRLIPRLRDVVEAGPPTRD